MAWSFPSRCEWGSRPPNIEHTHIYFITYFSTVFPFTNCILFPVGLSSLTRHFHQVVSSVSWLGQVYEITAKPWSWEVWQPKLTGWSLTSVFRQGNVRSASTGPQWAIATQGDGVNRNFAILEVSTWFTRPEIIRLSIYRDILRNYWIYISSSLAVGNAA